MSIKNRQKSDFVTHYVTRVKIPFNLSLIDSFAYNHGSAGAYSGADWTRDKNYKVTILRIHIIHSHT